MYLNGAYRAADGTHDSWLAYRRGLYKRDRTFDAARSHTRAGATVVTHWHAHEIPEAHRRAIYTRHGVRERASLVEDNGHGGVLAVNLYRHESQPAFDAQDLGMLCQWHAPLLAAIKLHLRAVPEAPAEKASSLARLPRREREVCTRLLRGMTYDGIAADLGISAGTVKTYRDRAFDRLGLHHRNELFALALAESTN